ncbi:Wzz/FepE/Etk N-terminal domain-containing protein [Parafrankia discariae]|uniref:Wzz/FepE/Etk N-terminal domain-containing protein n=1 Tax=Parafrankia discariae TaxID=365528 RepID=UPI0003A1B801|nr:Wzz/FepE/Etk N-terminal domain-containing protein [Parafrankia discariae]
MSRSSQQGTESGRAPSAPSLIRILKPRWMVIAISVVILAALAMIVSKQQTATFQASSRIFLDTSGDTLGANSVDAGRFVQTQAQLATSTATLDEIGTKLKISRADVASRLKTTPSDEGYFFTITGTGTSEQAAIDFVNAAKDAYTSQLGKSGAGDGTMVEGLTRARDSKQGEIDGLIAQRDPAVTNNTLDNQIKVLQGQVGDLNTLIQKAGVGDATAAGTIRLAEQPRSEGQVAPSLFRNVLVATLLGLFGSAAGLWIMYQRRPTILDPHNSADLMGVPLIADLPASRTSANAAETLVSAMSAVMSPTSKVVAFTPASRTDLSSELVAAVAAAWSDDQGVVLILDTSAQSEVRASLEGLPRPTSAELPRWAHEPTCLARSSGTGRGHILYNRVSPARAARPGGLAPILADRAPVVDLVILVTAALADLPMTAASAIQADAVVVITSPDTNLKELEQVPRDWPALAERVVGVVHDGRTAVRRNAGGARGSSQAAVESITSASPVGGEAASRGPRDTEATDRYARPAKR